MAGSSASHFREIQTSLERSIAEWRKSTEALDRLSALLMTGILTPPHARDDMPSFVGEWKMACLCEVFWHPPEVECLVIVGIHP